MKEKYIALTFDDGPNTTTTLDIIDKLIKYSVPASFFVVGDNIDSDSEIAMKKAFSAGCEIQNHSKTHSAFPSLSDDKIREELAFTDEKVISAVGVKPGFFRPPYIAVDDRVLALKEHILIAGIGAEDWLDTVDAKMRAERIINNIYPGGIILLHDAKGNYMTADALDIIIPTLKDMGYTFVTISGLFEKCGVTPKHGIVYSNVYQEGIYELPYPYT